MMHPPGTIALPVGELARFSAFTYSAACLQYPPGTTIAMMQSLSIPRNLNEIIRDSLARPDDEWVWLQADDHVFEPDLLTRLLDRELDVVVPLIVRRRPPFAPVLFKAETENHEYEPFAYDELPEEGLLEVYAAGTGGMLVRRHVLEAIGDPWFEFQRGEILNEDVEFCRKIRDAGFKIHADLSCRMGHAGLFIVWPRYQDGWGINFQMGEGPEGAMNAIYVKPGAQE